MLHLTLLDRGTGHAPDSAEKEGWCMHTEIAS
jgi:hypothetical protein